MSEPLLSGPRLLVVASTLVGLGALGFHFIDGMIVEDAGGTPWINAFYCSVITLTTVGYGDICPSDTLSHLGRLFVVLLSFSGLGMFCGPVMDYSASWKERLPGGAVGPGIIAIVLGTLLFVYLEEMETVDAMYFSVVTGTTVGYGDMGPKTDYGRLATAIFAVFVVNVVGAMLEPAKHYLSLMCEVPHPPSKADAPVAKTTEKEEKKASTKKDRKKKD